MSELTPSLKNKIIWWLFWIMIAFLVIDVLAAVVGIQLPAILQIIGTYVSPIILILHMLWFLGYLRGVLFAALAAVVGFIAEYLGTHFGWIFGGSYVYAERGVLLFDVPLSVIFYWIIFIYLGYMLTNSFLVWIKKTKPALKDKNLPLLPFLVILDGLFVVAIDIFMDPLAVRAGSWAWENPGPYFEIPIGNFFGWFLVAIVVTGIFRLFEYFKPGKETVMSKSLYIVPVIIYALICVSYIFNALNVGLLELTLIGFFAMMPVVFLNVMLFMAWRHSNPKQPEKLKENKSKTKEVI